MVAHALLILNMVVLQVAAWVGSSGQPAEQPVAVHALTLQRVVVEVPEPQRLKVALLATPPSGGASRAFSRSRLLLAGQDIPLASPGVATDQPGNTVVHLEIDLAALPADVLTLPTGAVTVRWEGVTDGGRTVVTVAGTLDPANRSRLTIAQDDVYALYARLDNPSVTPEGTNVVFRGLASILNPFSFDVVAKGLDYRVLVGGEEVMSGRRPGFRLRPGQRSDVLLEAEVSLASAAAAAAAVLRGAAVEVMGQLHLATTDGDRLVPIVLRSRR